MYSRQPRNRPRDYSLFLCSRQLTSCQPALSIEVGPASVKIGLDILQASLLGRRRSTGLPGPSVLLRSSLSSGIDCVWCFPPLSRTSRVGFRCLGSASQRRKPPRHHFNHDDPHDLPRRLRYYLASPHLTHRVPSTYLGIVLVEVDILRRRSSAFKSWSACFLLKCRTWRDCCTARIISSRAQYPNST